MVLVLMVDEQRTAGAVLANRQSLAPASAQRQEASRTGRKDGLLNFGDQPWPEASRCVCLGALKLETKIEGDAFGDIDSHK